MVILRAGNAKSQERALALERGSTRMSSIPELLISYHRSKESHLCARHPVLNEGQVIRV